MSIRDSIIRLVGRHNLDEAESAAAMNEIMSGVATPSQIAAFLTALHLKGETAAEIAGMARIMRDHALHVDVAPGAVDTCGTGGDGAGTFNISTIAAFVAAGAGVHIAKHGNRAMSSRCGSADVLEGLGVSIEFDQIEVAKRIRTQRFGFMFAPRFHPAMRFAGPVRRLQPTRTTHQSRQSHPPSHRYRQRSPRRKIGKCLGIARDALRNCLCGLRQYRRVITCWEQHLLCGAW